MPVGHSDLSRVFTEHPELSGRYIYFCPTREVSVAARFTEGGQIELLFDGSKHEYARPILESVRNKLQADGANATYLESLEDAEGSDKLIRLLYTKPHCQGKCLSNLWKMLHTPNPQKSNAGAPMPMQMPTLMEQEMKLSKLDFLALFSVENDQELPIHIAEARGVAPPVQLPEPPPGIDCVGIPAVPYKEYEQMAADMNMFKLPMHIKLQDNVYRDVRCTGHRLQEPGCGGLCIICREAKKAIDGLKAKLELRYCMGIPKVGWVEDLLKIRPIPNVEDHGDRYRHKKCTKRREGRSIAAECCNLCKLMKQRLRAAKRNRQVRTPKDPRKQRNWLLYTSPKYLTGLEMGEQREKMKAERAEELLDERASKRWQNADESVRQKRLRALIKPMKPMYVRMTMQLMNPQCEWGDCQERFPTVKDLTRHVHLVHMPTIAPEIGIAGEDGALGEAGAAQEIYRCQWRGCPFTDPNPLSLRQHLYMGYHMGSGRLMQFESNWYANRYKILCKWKDCPMADQPFTTLKAMYDHLEQDHFQPPPPPPEAPPPPSTDESPPKRPPKHTMLQCRWVGCDGPRYPDAELLRQHVDQHFGGALRALWQPAESMVEVRRALSVLVQTPAAENEEADDEEEPLPDDEEEEDFDGWRLEWDYRNQQQEPPAQQIIAQAQMEATPKRRGRKAQDEGIPSANLLPEQILETERDDATTNSTPKKRTAVEAAAAAAHEEGEAPETGDTPSTEIRRSARAKKPTVRLLEAKRFDRIGDDAIDVENEEGLGEGDDDMPLELRKKARKLPRRRSLKGEKKDQHEHLQGSAASDALIVMEVPTEQKRRRMRQSFRQHVLFVPEVTEFDFDTYYLLWEYYDSLIGIGIGMKKRIQEMKTAAASGRSTRIEDDYDYPVTWDRLRNRKSKQKMYQITQRPPSYSSYLKSTSVQLYKARLMLAHSICFWGQCREQFQTIRQLADHVAASHLKPLFDKGTIENIPCCWRHCVMVFKNTRSLLTHVAESHIGNEDLMDFQESGCTPPVPAECTCFWTGCGLTFTNYSAFHEHVRNAHIKVFHGSKKSGEKFRCQWADCTQEVTTQMNLSAHMQHLHIGDDWLSKLCHPPTEQEILDTKAFHFNRPIPLQINDPDWFYDQFWLKKGRNVDGFPRSRGRWAGHDKKPPHGVGLPMKTSEECVARDAQLLMNPQCFWAGCIRPRFQKVKDLVDHVENAHLKVLEQPGMPKRFNFRCQWAGCKKDVHTVRAIRHHMRQHWGSSALVRLQEEGLNFAPNCYWGACRAQFNSLEELIEHVDSRHLGPLKHYEFPGGLQCKWFNCGRALSGLKGLEIHVKSMHTGTAWAVEMLNLLQGTSAIDTPTQAMNPIWHAKPRKPQPPRQRPVPIETAVPRPMATRRRPAVDELAAPMPMAAKKMKKIKKIKKPEARVGSKRKAPLNASSSSSSRSSSGSESEDEEETPQWEMGQNFGAPLVASPPPPARPRRIQQQRRAAQPKVRVQPASAQYEDYGSFMQQPQQPDTYGSMGGATPQDENYEVYYVPVRVPKGSRVSVPEGSYGRVEVDQGGGRRRTMMLVDEQQQQQKMYQAAAAAPSITYQYRAPAGQQRQSGGAPVRFIIARAGTSGVQYQRAQLQVQQQAQQHPSEQPESPPFQYQDPALSPTRTGAVSGIGAYLEI